MSESVNLPDLGDGITTAIVGDIFKKAGDKVSVNDTLLEVETEEFFTDISSPVDGTVQLISVAPQQKITVGQQLVVVKADADDSDDTDVANTPEQPATKPATPPVPPVKPADKAEGTSDSDKSTKSEDKAEDTASKSDSSEDSEVSKADKDTKSVAKTDVSKASSQDEDSQSDKADKGDNGETQEIKLPELGESVTEGTITRWLVKEGDTVEVDQPIVEISTDKVDSEVPSPVAGTITKLVAQEDDDIEVGGVLAEISGGDTSGTTSSKTEEKSSATKTDGKKTETSVAAASAGAATVASASVAASSKSSQNDKEDSTDSSGDKTTTGSDEGTEIKLPELGESVTEGTITRWLVQEGDTVEVDQPIVEISTDKVDSEVPSPVAGTITKLVAQEDDDIEVGGVLAMVGGSASAGTSTSSDSASKAAEAAKTEKEDTASDDKDDKKADTTSAYIPAPRSASVPEESPAPSSGKTADASSKTTTSTDEGEGQDIVLPELGESVTEGTITRWLVQEGDTVEVDQPIVEISTDKVDSEVPSPVAGTISEILAHEDDEVEVGAVLAKVGGSSSKASASSDSSAKNEDTVSAASAPTTSPSSAAATESSSSETDDAADQDSSDGEGTEIKLPELGESVTEGTLTRWLVQEGDAVEVDQPIVEISTDKVDSEVPSPVAGKVTKLLAEEDDTIEVGQPLAMVGGSGSSSSSSQKSSADNSASTQAATAAAVTGGAAAGVTASSGASQTAAPAASTSSDKGVYASPLVRKDAREKGIDLSTVQGSGVGGRITREDLAKASGTSIGSAVGGSTASAATAAVGAAAKPAGTKTPAAPAQANAAQKPATSPADTGREYEVSPLRGTTEKASRMRQVIAQRMQESLANSAQLTQVHEVDMTNVVNLRNATKDQFLEQNGTKLTFLPFFAKAVAEALQQFPKLNATFNQDDKTINYPASEDIAFAVDTPKGLLVPVVRNCGDMSVADFAKSINDVAARTRDGKIGPDELSGGTFTITNYGSVGAISDTPIINQPQSAILGLGAIVKRPVVLPADGQETIAIRSIVTLSLTYDHSLVDGADAGRFMQAVKKRLEAADFDV